MAIPAKPFHGGFDPHGCIHAFVVPLAAALKTELRIRRKLRIQVLDCRSGQPLARIAPERVLLAPVGEAFDNERHAAVRFELDFDWDIVANYIIPVGGDGAPQDWTGLGPSNRKKLQAALTALGYNSGRLTASFSEQDWRAFKDFQDAWYDDNPGEQRPARFERKVPPVWVKRILAAYNKRFHTTVQTYLAAVLDLSGTDKDPQTEAGEWGPLSEEALARWQRLDFPETTQPFTTFNSLRKASQRKKLAQKLKDSQKRFFTDSNGILHVAVPVERLREGFQVKVEFADFAVIHERAGFRQAAVTGATRFRIEWPDTAQDKEAGPWGWRLRPPSNTAARNSLPEFQAFFQAQVAPAPELSWRKLDAAALARSSFMPFYLDGDRNPEIVLFALVWCQPVWDDIADPQPPANTNLRAYVDPNGGDRGRFMHIVTRAWDMGGTYAEAGSYAHRYGGKGYGKIEHAVSTASGYRVQGTTHATRWRSGDGHAGIDIHAGVGDKIFAMHGGTVRRKGSEYGTAGWFVELTWARNAVGVNPGGRTSVSCLHVSEFIAANRARVKAGEILAAAGRTGNLDFTSSGNRATDQGNPGHTHLNMGVHGYTGSLRTTPSDAFNQWCVPTNETALLFPCACQITPPGEETRTGYDPAGCHFKDAEFTKKCWAVAELACPYMADERSTFRLQAQLRYLFEQHGAPLTNPGDPAGVMDDKTRRAVRNFRAWAELTPGEEMDDGAWQALDENAPLVLPEGAAAAQPSGQGAAATSGQ